MQQHQQFNLSSKLHNYSSSPKSHNSYTAQPHLLKVDNGYMGTEAKGQEHQNIKISIER